MMVGENVYERDRSKERGEIKGITKGGYVSVDRVCAAPLEVATMMHVTSGTPAPAVTRPSV